MTNSNKLPTTTTRNGADLSDAVTGIIESVTTHGGVPIRVLPRFNADGAITAVSVIADGKKHGKVNAKTGEVIFHRYIATTPRATDASYPKLVVNGKTRKNVSYERGAFPAHGTAANTAARLIATVKVTDAIVTMGDGTLHTLTGVWTIMAMVKTLENGRLLQTVHAAPGEHLVVNCVNA